MYVIINRIRKWSVLFLIASIVLVCFVFNPEFIRADELSDAYEFYGKYGNEMLFQPGQGTDGQIYYATKAKRANTGIQYTTLGWKVTVYNYANVVVDELYYKLGGAFMVCIDTQNIDGYEYCLYSVSLENLKGRMNETAKAAIGRANAKIIFDACTTTKINGQVQGEMTDEGPVGEGVYETYEEIVNAQKWSETTKETLKTYYNKQVQGLFYSVQLKAGEGIEAVHGQGAYCYGSKVLIVAQVEKGYHFAAWTGDMTFSEEKSTFTMGAKDIQLVAVAEMNQYNIVFDSNGGAGEIPMLQIAYDQQFMLPRTDIYREGYCLYGWSRKAEDKTAEFSLSTPVQVMELVTKGMNVLEHGTTIVLYAMWDQAPEIFGEDIYVSLEDAMRGIVTEEWLSGYVYALDAEDGEIPYGENIKNSFFIMDYLATDFIEFRKDGAVTETFCAIDSAGNEVRKRITVHIVDTTVQDADLYLGSPRFISEKYFKNSEGHFIDEKFGGLKENSSWRINPAYTEVLDALFQ